MTIENKRNNYTIWERSFVVRVRKNRLRRGRDSPDVANDTCRVREKRAQLLFFEVKKRWRESKGGGREKEREGGGDLYGVTEETGAATISVTIFEGGERRDLGNVRTQNAWRRGIETRIFFPPFSISFSPEAFPFCSRAFEIDRANSLARSFFFPRHAVIFRHSREDRRSLSLSAPHALHPHLESGLEK